MPTLRQLGPYRLLRRLGTGGMGEVWLATAFGASGFAAPVALKILRTDVTEDPELARLLIEEARRGARLRHRNLVAIDDLVCDDGIYGVRMEYIDGGDLGSVLRNGRLPPVLAAHVAEEIALALAYVHAAEDDSGRPLGLVHRDVSVANILLSRAGEVKLGDLGVAKANMLADVTRPNVHKGSWAYMSPEQAMGAPVTAASDQFGLGAVLAEMLTGTRAFEADDPIATLERVRLATPPALPGIDPALADVVRRCLEKDPARRFADALALYSALRSLRSTLGEAGPPELSDWVRIALA